MKTRGESGKTGVRRRDMKGTLEIVGRTCIKCHHDKMWRINNQRFKCTRCKHVEMI